MTKPLARNYPTPRDTWYHHIRWLKWHLEHHPNDPEALAHWHLHYPELEPEEADSYAQLDYYQREAKADIDKPIPPTLKG